MLRNVLDIDFEAQVISLRTNRGAIVLFDFRSAFPSISHDYLWDALLAVGLPAKYVQTLQLFYKRNKHFLKIGGKFYDSVEVHSGVRQGCPLSPVLFALAADVLLRELADTLGRKGTVKAFADDTAVAFDDYVTVAPSIARLFWEFERISALALNISKTVFIPLWPISSSSNLRKIIVELCPLWKNIIVQTYGKYLGFAVGPGSTEHMWTKPLHKYLQRAREWASLRLGMFYNLTVYRTFICSVLSLFMQRVEDPTSLLDYSMAVLRLLLGERKMMFWWRSKMPSNPGGRGGRILFFF